MHNHPEAQRLASTLTLPAINSRRLLQPLLCVSRKDEMTVNTSSPVTSAQAALLVAAGGKCSDADLDWFAERSKSWCAISGVTVNFGFTQKPSEAV